MEGLLQDLRYALRSLRGNPGLILVAGLSLALGIGANTTIFSAVDVFMLRPLPYDEADRLVRVWESNRERGWTQSDFSPPNYLDTRAESRTLELAAYRYMGHNLSHGDQVERLQGQQVAANYFSVLGVTPAFGRAFLPEEEEPGRGHVAVLGYGLWQRLGGDRGLVGGEIRLDGEAYTVVGVMPQDFRFIGATVEIWTPLAFTGEEQRASHYLDVLGRLRPGATLESAREELEAITSGLGEAYPAANRGMGATLTTLHRELYDETFRTATAIATASVFFVLLIACANVANLLLAKAAGRNREIALRSALGAGRLRITRQLLIESLVIALVGGAAGLLLSVAGIRGMLSLMPAWFPRVEEIGLDGRVVGFTALITVGAGILFGLMPALQAARPDLRNALTEGGRTQAGGRRRGRTRHGLVVAEVSLALVLLVAAGLLIRGFANLRSVQLGFDSEQVLTMRVTLPETRYPDEESVAAFYRTALERLAALPGVEAVGATTILPFEGNTGTYYSVVGEPMLEEGRQPVVSYRMVSPGYFEALGIPLQAGRGFTEQDGVGGPPVIMINESMARRHWEDGDPLGQRLAFGSGEREIVGVVGDVRVWGPSNEAPSMIYFPALDGRARAMSFAMKTPADPGALSGPARARIRELDPDQPVYAVQPMTAVFQEAAAADTIMAKLLGVFALIALLLAVVGVYGVMAYNVTQRTHEMGIRTALGASRGDILKMVVRQGTTMALLGITIGLLAASGVTRTLSAFLYGVSAFDPATFGGVALTLAAAAVAASYVPALRATRVDPIIALREE